MKKNRLMPMVDFVIKTNSQEHSLNNLMQIRSYANFLKQPLELWMFVPCDLIQGKIVVLNEGDKHCQQAKERCLFEIYSFEGETENFWYFGIDELTLIGVEKNGIIEDLVKYNLTLKQKL